jgi:hypothetical protein
MTSAFLEMPDFQAVLAENWPKWDDNPTAQVVSLATMLKVRAAALAQIAMDIEFLRHDLQQGMNKAEEGSQFITPEMLKNIQESSAKVLRVSQEVNLPQTAQKAQYLCDLYAHPEGSGTYLTALKDTEHLRYDFIKELGHAKFFKLDDSLASFFVGNDPGATPFGKEVLDAFPSAAMDVREASNAYALERWPACVFHLMRVLEFGLRTMADKFGVAYESATWHVVIEQIEAKVRKIDQSFGPDWKQQKKNYSDACTQFMFFKDAWRNHIMHVRDVYDPWRARSIWQHVQEFMRKLVSIGLQETP